MAAQKLGLNIADCVIFEDAEAGIIAAQRANARVIVVGESFYLLPVIQNYTALEYSHL